MKKKLLFLTLNTFSATGGIEKVCRVAGKALYELTDEEDNNISIYSMYDRQHQANEEYFPAAVFKGFAGKKLSAVWNSIRKGWGSDVVLLSHINLLSVGYLIKKISPRTRLVLIAHGIEVWEPLQGIKKKMLQAVDLFLPVSSFTGQKLEKVNGIIPSKIKVLNNCVDPFLRKETNPTKELALKNNYGFKKDDFILLTLTRLKFSEQYKGYDRVVKALACLKDSHPQLKYLIVGRYEDEEKARLDNIIASSNMADRVVFAGYVRDEDLAAHFNISDLYIMPSSGEGFGIVFIEALFYGLPVIAGNVDGSVDALAGGEFGLLVNPDKIEEIVAAILESKNNKMLHIPTSQKVEKRFGFPRYKNRLGELLFPEKYSAKVGADTSFATEGCQL